MKSNRHRQATQIIHFGAELDSTTGASSVPIYQASTYKQQSIKDKSEFVYSRWGNPTRRALEEYIAVLEHGTSGFAFSSGMAAISAAFMLLKSGDHVICTEDVYGGTHQLLTGLLSNMDISTTFVDMDHPEHIQSALQQNTKIVYLETPSNPTLKITDIQRTTEWARSKGLLTVIDNTFMTPYFQKPLDLGADIVIHSASKFLGGHSDLLAGLIAVKDDNIANSLSEIQQTLGSVLGVQDCWLLMRGMKTLKPRMDVFEQTANRLATWLKAHPSVHAVYYPGLSEHPHRNIHESQASGYGAVVSFDVQTEERACILLERLEIPITAVSLGGIESIISYPAAMSHRKLPRQQRLKLGISDGLLRYSVGLEDIEDILEDMEKALSTLEPL